MLPTFSSNLSSEGELSIHTTPVATSHVGNRNADPQASPLSHTVSSQFASAVGTLTFYPFDTLKVRFMSQDGTFYRQHNGQTYRSIGKALSTICREEGLCALFRGCHVAVMGSVFSWGLYMYMYRSLCNFSDVSSYLGRAGVSFLSSFTASFMSSPIWLVKSRMQLEDTITARNYASFCKGFQHVLRTTGFCSLWRGVLLQLSLVLPNSLNIPTYDFLKGLLLRARFDHTSPNDELSILEVSLCSTATKTLLVCMSHPLMMLKIRLQDQRWDVGEVKYTNIRHSVGVILKREGPTGMLRGVVPSLLHSLPRALTYFVLYEKTLSFMCRYI